uniref:Uncharacterized protein n=1 Tax=Arion vulgaris TaxID=1028688 RepID=A0A0B7ASA2_9EUPU
MPENKASSVEFLQNRDQQIKQPQRLSRIEPTATEISTLQLYATETTTTLHNNFDVSRGRMPRGAVLVLEAMMKIQKTKH